MIRSNDFPRDPRRGGGVSGMQRIEFRVFVEVFEAFEVFEVFEVFSRFLKLLRFLRFLRFIRFLWFYKVSSGSSVHNISISSRILRFPMQL